MCLTGRAGGLAAGGSPELPGALLGGRAIATTAPGQSWGSHGPFLTHSGAGNGVVPTAGPKCQQSPGSLRGWRCSEPRDAKAEIASEATRALKPFLNTSCSSQRAEIQGKSCPREQLSTGVQLQRMGTALAGAPGAPRGSPAPRGRGPELSCPWRYDKCGGRERGREGGRAFSQEPCGKSETSGRGSLTARLMISPREPGRHHKSRQFAPEIGEET